MTRRLVVEADGGSRGNPGPAAYGAVLREADTGQVIAERWECIGVATNNVAEYRGLIAGLEAAVEQGADIDVQVRLDSKLIVEQMSGRWKIKDPTLRQLAIQARDILSGDRVAYTWVPREQNKAADALVNRALDTGTASVAGAQVPATTIVAPVEKPVRAIAGWAPDLGEPTLTMLVRHGVTLHTQARLFSGAGGEDPPLTPLGREQALRTAEELIARGGADRVVASPLRRARESAAIIAERIGTGEVEVDPGFEECGFGEWDGLTFGEVRERWSDEMTAWLASTAVAPPGGESFDDHRLRVDLARRELLARHRDERIVVVSHVTPIKMMLGIALDAPIHSLYRMELQPSSITTIAWWHDGNCSVRGFADSAHLRGLAVPG